MRSTLRTVFARAEIMFVLLAGAVFVCWQQERSERQERVLLRAAVEAERKRDFAAAQTRRDAALHSADHCGCSLRSHV